MAKRRKTTRSRRTTKKQQEGPAIRPEFAGTLLLILAVITFLSLVTPNTGFFVTTWLEFLRFLIGWGRYVFWLVLTLLAFWFFRAYSIENADEKWEKPVGTFLLLGLLLVGFHLISPGEGLIEPGGGGALGWILGELLRSALGTAGTVVLLIGFAPILIILISGLSLRRLVQIIRDLYYRFQDWRHFRQLTINQPLARPRPLEPKTRFIDRMFPDSRNKSSPTRSGDGEPLMVIGAAKEVSTAVVSHTPQFGHRGRGQCFPLAFASSRPNL
jgi:hypothetical protein